ncbi:lamin tail domain-containing protein [Myxococcota bacterium]|nr:lamin tail domain-containing protein [Myxococcota bacterium]
MRNTLLTTLLLAASVFIVSCDDGSKKTTGECTNGESRDGTTVCGLFDEGVFIQSCVANQWVDTDQCSSDAVCEDGDTQVGTTVCGLNDEGFRMQECVLGQWADTAGCTGDDQCQNGDTRNGQTVCGDNDEGVLVQECVLGAWADTAECNITPVCTPGDTQVGPSACGLNGEGFFMQDCIEGHWFDNADCTGTDICENGTTQVGTTVCGLNYDGLFMQDCTAGAWVDNDTCTGTDVCINGTAQEGTTVCGLNDEGHFMQDCTSGAWVDNDTCTGTDVCVNGATQEGTTPCGFNDSGVLQQDCVLGQFVDGAVCLNEILLVLNEIQTGLAGWVEIFNAGAADIDASGYFIQVNSYQYELPPGTILAAGQYYSVDTIAADVNSSTVSLLDAAYSVQDTISWSTPQDIYGRFPNGTGAFVSLYIPTKNLQNTDLHPLAINSCNVAGPHDYMVLPGTSVQIFGQVYIVGYTGAQGVVDEAEPQVRSRLCYTDGGVDYCEKADFDEFATAGNNDQYVYALNLSDAGDYLYWYEFSGDLGNTWTTCTGLYVATILGTPACDVSGFTLRQQNSTQNYTFPAGTIIPAGQTLVLGRSALRADFEAAWSVTLSPATLYLNSGGFAVPQINGAETFQLLNASAVSLDGPSIPVVEVHNYQRVSAIADPALPASWVDVNNYLTATPGTYVGTAPGSGLVVISEFSDATEFENEFVELFCDK